MELVKIINLTKQYEDVEVVSNVNFSLNEGEIVGLVGNNGAGKTTTMKMIVGLAKPTKGTVLFNGKDIFENLEYYLSSVDAMIESPAFYPFLSGRENVNYFIDKNNKNNRIIDELIDIFEMRNYLDKKVNKYSLGMKQKLGIVRTIAKNPQILVLDEPTNGLDVHSKLKFRSCIKKIIKEEKKALLISSHDLTEIESICDRVLFIDNGKIVDAEKKKTENQFFVECDNCKEVYDYLQSKNEISVVSKENNRIIYVQNDLSHNVVKEMFLNDYKITAFGKVEDSLLDVYFKVTGDNNEEINI
ncbi:MAG: ABC transporter ATP-binding protein [Lachnospiraceae bacterium]|nr:ABC transporter ATP-binding protein [Lachnospiraceae bacterium]